MFRKWLIPSLCTASLFCISCQSQVFLFTTLSLGNVNGSSLVNQSNVSNPINESQNLPPSVPPPVATPTPIPIPTATPGNGEGNPTPSADSPPPSTPAPTVTPTLQTAAGFTFATGKPASISLAPSSLTLSKQGEQQSLIVRVKNADGEFLDPATVQIVWESSNPDQISVNENGVITAVNSSGGVTITAKIANTSIAASVQVQMGSSGSQPPPPDLSNQDALQGIIDFS